MGPPSHDHVFALGGTISALRMELERGAGLVLASPAAEGAGASS